MEQQTYESQSNEPWVIPSFDDSNKSFELIDPGMYTLVLNEVGAPQAVASQYDPTGKKRRAQFTFKVVGDEHWDGYEINMWMNISMNEKSTLYPFVKAILGETLDHATSVQPSMLTGRRFKGMVVHQEPNASGQIWPTIKTPIPFRSSSRVSSGDVGSGEDLSDAPF